MSRLTRYARGSLVAVAGLALTAGAAFAARELTPTSDHSTRIVAAEPTETLQATDMPEASDAPEASDTPEATDAVDASRPQNHGFFVSQAAQASTPPGFANHGAYVSSIAHGSDGKSAKTHRH